MLRVSPHAGGGDRTASKTSTAAAGSQHDSNRTTPPPALKNHSHMIQRHTQHITQYSLRFQPTQPSPQAEAVGSVYLHSCCVSIHRALSASACPPPACTLTRQGGVVVVLSVAFLFLVPLVSSCLKGAKLQHVRNRPRPYLTTPVHHSAQAPPSWWSSTSSPKNHTPLRMWAGGKEAVACFTLSQTWLHGHTCPAAGSRLT